MDEEEEEEVEEEEEEEEEEVVVVVVGCDASACPHLCFQLSFVSTFLCLSVLPSFMHQLPFICAAPALVVSLLAMPVQSQLAM